MIGRSILIKDKGSYRAGEVIVSPKHLALISILQEKCVWHTLDDELVEINFRKRASARLSDMLRRARLGYEERGIKPHWMGENMFKEMLVYWKSDEFKK